MRTLSFGLGSLLLLVGSVSGQATLGPCSGNPVKEVFPGGAPAPGLGSSALMESSWETIAPDYSNIRGLNYVPHWAGSSVGTWKSYDPQQVEKDLGYLNGIGCNAVRVWMSEIVFRVEGDAFIGKFSDFLRRCEAHSIYVIPVVWDEIGSEPSETPYQDTSDWVQNPATLDANDPGYWAAFGDPYVEALVCAARGSRALLMWDVMNEPGVSISTAFLRHYAQLLKSLAQEDTVTIGWAAAHSNSVSAGWPEIDVLSYHPYGCFRENVEVWTLEMREISEANGDKPILATEIASPGIVQRYEDALVNISAEGVGFMFFQAMIGPPPHFLLYQDGFFYKDGEVRDAVGVQAFQDFSIAQGYTGKLLPVIEKPASDPLAVPMIPVPLGFGGPELIQTLSTWLDRPPLQPAFVPFFKTMQTWATISLAWLGVLEPEDVDLIRDLVDAFDAEVDAGNYAQADLWLDSWGYFNWFFVDLYGLNG